MVEIIIFFGKMMHFCKVFGLILIVREAGKVFFIGFCF